MLDGLINTKMIDKMGEGEVRELGREFVQNDII